MGFFALILALQALSFILKPLSVELFGLLACLVLQLLKLLVLFAQLSLRLLLCHLLTHLCFVVHLLLLDLKLRLEVFLFDHDLLVVTLIDSLLGLRKFTLHAIRKVMHLLRCVKL